MRKPLSVMALLLTAVLSACSTEGASSDQNTNTSPTVSVASKSEVTQGAPAVGCITLKQGPGKGYDKNSIPSDPNFKHLPCIHEGWRTEKRPSLTEKGVTETYVVGSVTNDSGIPIKLFDLEFPAFDGAGKELTKCRGMLDYLEMGAKEAFQAYCPDAATETVGEPFLTVVDDKAEAYK